MKIGVVFAGHQAPGGQNVIDGLLRYKAGSSQQSGAFVKHIVGFMNGNNGLVSGDHVEITDEWYGPYRNLGGYSFLGTGNERLSEDDVAKAAVTCANLNLDGLVIVGDHDTMTDAAKLSAAMPNTKVIVAPASIDGNVDNQYI